MDVGKRLAQLRTDAGLTTNRLANLCGLSQSFVRSVELGEKGITVDNLALLCQVLGISLADFFDTGESDQTEDALLLSQLQRLSPEQKQALALFPKTI